MSFRCKESKEIHKNLYHYSYSSYLMKGHRVWVTGMVKEREYVTRVSLERTAL